MRGKRHNIHEGDPQGTVTYTLNDSNCILSIVIPVYNGRQYIKECVDAVREVSWSHEILLVNDGSTDDSLAYMQTAFADYSDVAILDKENGGICSARNYGTAHAVGKYIYYADQDDQPVAAVIDAAIVCCEEQNCDMAYWSTVVEQGNVTRPCDTVLQDAIVERDTIESEIVPTFLSKSRNHYVTSMGHLWGGLFRKEIIAEHQLTFKRFVYCEDDYLFLLDYLVRAHRVCFLREVGYNWVRRETSQSAQQGAVDHYWDKAEQMYTYVCAACRAGGIAVPSEFLTFIHQNIPVCALENCASVVNPYRREETRDWKCRMQNPEIRDACRQESVRQYMGRQGRMWALIHRGMYTGATWYAYADSMLRRMRGR